MRALRLALLTATLTLACTHDYSSLAGRRDGAASDGATGAGGGGPRPCDSSCDMTCNTCENGICAPRVGDVYCGPGSCGGPELPSGFGAGTYPTVAMNHICRGGVCTAEPTDCRTKSCILGTGCSAAQYLGCFLNSDGYGFGDPAAAECRCVNTTGGFCPQPVIDGAGGTGGMAGTGGAGGTGGSLGACNNPAPCSSGELVMIADYWCNTFESHPVDDWGACVNGHLSGYYNGLPCPFDIAIAHTSGWTGPCDGCIDGAIITNFGTSTSAAWRATPTARYCCDGPNVRKLTCP